jgi:aldose 1-epimerase
MPAPSGRQIHLVYEDQEAVVVTLGAGLRSYQVRGQPVVDGYAETEMCSGGRGQVLMPWPNRLADGRFEWAGRELQTPLSEPERHNAIHGLVRWTPWTVSEVSDESARLTLRLYPQPGWPWMLDLSVRYALSAGGLTVAGRVENQPAGAGSCPFGAGWHPYLAAFGGRVDDALLMVPAATSYVMDDRGLPVSTRPVAGTPSDFRQARPVGAAKLDTAFTDLTRDDDGRAVVEFTAGDGSLRVTRLWMDTACTHVMVFSGDTVAEPGRRRRGLAVEPMTCAPNMLQTGDGRVVLEEGEGFEATWGLTTAGF